MEEAANHAWEGHSCCNKLCRHPLAAMRHVALGLAPMGRKELLELALEGFPLSWTETGLQKLVESPSSHQASPSCWDKWTCALVSREEQALSHQ